MKHQLVTVSSDLQKKESGGDFHKPSKFTNFFDPPLEGVVALGVHSIHLDLKKDLSLHSLSIASSLSWGLYIHNVLKDQWVLPKNCFPDIRRCGLCHVFKAKEEWFAPSPILFSTEIKTLDNISVRILPIGGSTSSTNISNQEFDNFVKSLTVTLYLIEEPTNLN